MKISKTLCVVFCLGLISPVATAQDGPLPYNVPRSEVHTITAEQFGRSYSLYVKLPPGYTSAKNADRIYPVIFLTDDSYCFQTAAGVTHMPMNYGGLEHAILVGLSYAHGEGGAASRSRDLTPTSLGADEKYDHGGASEYLEFLKNDVIPFIEETYRADSTRRALVGQSYGGLFGTFVLLSEPILFSDYILTSASLWFDNEIIFAMEDAYAATNNSLNARVYFATGETETPRINGSAFDMVSQQERFVSILRNRGYTGLEVRDEVIEGATHQTTFPIGLLRGLMWLYAGPDPYNGGARWYGG